jgi:predicted anti-sigma-YlaC factor YlaD
MTQVCDQARRAIQEQLDGTAEPQVVAWLDEHLADCRRCRTERAWLRATVASLGTLAQVEPESDFVSSVLQQCRAARTRQEHRLAWPAGVLVALTATLLLLAGRALDLFAAGEALLQLVRGAGASMRPLAAATTSMLLSGLRALEALASGACTVLWASVGQVAPVYGTTLVVVVSLTLAFAVRHSPRLEPHWRSS